MLVDATELMERPTPPEEITAWLTELGIDSDRALHEVYPIVYQELRTLARSRLRHERDGHTLNTTALVHEAFLKLDQSRDIVWQGRGQFFALAAQAMRHILVDHARTRKRKKRNEGAPMALFDEALLVADERADEMIALDSALEALSDQRPRLARVVEYRFFAGLSIEETAQAMEVSTMTIKRDWNKAKAYLTRELRANAG